MDSEKVRTLICYPHVSAKFRRSVEDFAVRLRGDGIDCRIDTDEKEPIGDWPKWFERQHKWANYVVVISKSGRHNVLADSDKKPGKGSNFTFELDFIRGQIANGRSPRTKYLIVTLTTRKEDFVPPDFMLQGSSFCVARSDEYARLVDLLRGARHAQSSSLDDTIENANGTSSSKRANRSARRSPQVQATSKSMVPHPSEQSTTYSGSGIIELAVCAAMEEFFCYVANASVHLSQLKHVLETRPGKAPKVLYGIREMSRNLNDHLTKKAKETFNSISYSLHRYFDSRKHRSGMLPRICQKGLDKDSMVNDLFRDWYTGQANLEPFKLSANTAFRRAAAEREPQIVNDIPTAARLGKYKNTRLSDMHVQAYKPPRNGDYPDHAWMACWDVTRSAHEERPEPEACYKSVLVVPIVFPTYKLPAAFQAIPSKTVNSSDVYGFLTLDHHATDYFDETDKNVGKAFASMLSVYLVATRIFTDTPVYRNATALLKDCNLYEASLDGLSF